MGQLRRAQRAVRSARAGFVELSFGVGWHEVTDRHEGLFRVRCRPGPGLFNARKIAGDIPEQERCPECRAQERKSDVG